MTRTFKIQLSLSTGPDYYLTGFSPTTGDAVWSIDRPLARQYDGPTLRLAWNTLLERRIPGEITVIEDVHSREMPNPVTC